MKLLLGSSPPRIGGRGAVRLDLLHSFFDLVLVYPDLGNPRHSH
jgi:hypothetical protein